MLEIITRLRQAEKDAARYRWLRDLTDGSAHEEIGNYPGDMWDAAIDEAMQCNANLRPSLEGLFCFLLPGVTMPSEQELKRYRWESQT